MGNEISAELMLVGAFDPDAVTHTLGIAPTRTWRRGEVPRPGAAPRREDGWELAIPRGPSDDVVETVSQLFDAFGRRFTDVAAVARVVGASVGVSCGVTIDPDGSTPALHLPLEMVGALFELGASFDVDLYVGESAASP